MGPTAPLAENELPEPPLKISPRAREVLETQYYRIESPMAGQRMWDELLSPDERRRLGGDFVEAYAHYRTIRMWVKVRGVCADRALAELAHLLGFIDVHRRDWLLRELGESVPCPEHELQPEWDRERLVLKLGTDVIRTVRGLRQAANIVAILDAFEEHGWPPRIDYPFGGKRDSLLLHKSIRSLNTGLKNSCFTQTVAAQAKCGRAQRYEC